MKPKSSNLRVIEPRIATFISSNDMYVLRDSTTHVALNVSFSPEGLNWTMNSSPNARNSSAKLVRFKNARIARIHNPKDMTLMKLEIVPTRGNLQVSDSVYIEKFVPRNHDDYRLQVAECVFVDKAYRLLTTLPTNQQW